MNRIDLHGQFAVVTGGARGVGYAIADRLLDSGASCCLWDRDEERLAKAARALSEKGAVHTVAVDVSDADSVDRAADATLRLNDRTDILVNNAGIAGPTKRTWQVTPEEFQEVLQVNLYGIFLCCRAIIPRMLEQQYGRIVNVASIAGKEGNPNASPYSAAKAGVIGLTKVLGKELAQDGVIVNCVTPAVIETEILETVPQSHIDYMLSKIPMGRFGTATEAAAMVAWLCSADVSFTTASVFDLSGGRATY
jgi:2-dehydro-3-deoxy-L-rhamnonate dehydrogenase (NAD+)